MRIDELNERFEIPKIARVEAGNGGLARVSITSPQASGEIYLQGAQVMVWRPAGAEEVVFVSGHSHWQAGKAIRGGVPVCFPWFRGKADNPQAPAHGFVRTRAWSLDSVAADGDGSVTVTCSTEGDEESRRLWPHEFRLRHRVTVGTNLRMELTVTNTGVEAFRFEEALHTYFRIGAAESVEVRGLDGVHYLDNTDGNREKVQAGALKLTGPTDNAYCHGDGAVEIVDPVLRRTLRTVTQRSGTTIVWNPWREGAAKLADLGDDEWQKMICVEGGNILSAMISIHPEQEHTLAVVLGLAEHAIGRS